MFWYHVKIACRNILQNKALGAFNVLGLSIGLAGTLLIMSWVSLELNFDSFFEKKDRIYRIEISSGTGANALRSCSSQQGLGPEALQKYPEVQEFARIREKLRTPFKVDENLFYVDKGLAADSSFFSVFSYEQKYGDPTKALRNRNSVVIDEYLAAKYFGKGNPVGESLQIDGKLYTIEAVIENVPPNSHLQFHFVTPMLNEPDYWHGNKWGSDNCVQYLVVNGNIDKDDLAQKLTSMLFEHAPMWKEYKVELQLMPLKDLHFSQGYILEFAKKGDKRNVVLLLSVAILILFIACVNFANMFLSASLKRIQSMGVKMVSGAKRKEVVKELLIEIFIYAGLSLMLGIIWVEAALPYFSQELNTQLHINYLGVDFLYMVLALAGVVLLIAFFIAILYFWRFNLVVVLKSGVSGSFRKKHTFQYSLITLQFAIAIGLIISVLVIQKQMHYFQSMKLGFDKENVAYTHTLGAFSSLQSLETLKQDLLNEPGIVGITARSCLQTDWENGGFMINKKYPEDKVHGEMVAVNQDYFEVMNIPFIEGEAAFNFQSDKRQYCVINQTAARALKLKPPYKGKEVFSVNGGKNLIISGVIADVYTKSLSQQVTPIMYTRAWEFYEGGVILYRLQGRPGPSVDAIKTYWQDQNSQLPFSLSFLDQTYNQLYRTEKGMQTLLSWFSGLSLLLTAMGLLAMVFHLTQAKSKEIGIRKVNGATLKQIIYWLNARFVRWVLVAFVIAVPITWYVMHNWLQTFAYRTTLNWWLFPLAGLVALVVALITVSWQTWWAANRNPVETLRYE
jgi:putative ABC transport system permease protein